MANETVQIKKYENRRLYDATNSRYVNLDEVAEMVRRGQDIQVVDAASGDDITRVILTQIIAEGAKASDSTFPLDILRQMVVASGRASQESAVRYTKAMLDLYQSTYRAMTPALNPFEFMQPKSGGKAARAGDGPQGAPAADPVPPMPNSDAARPPEVERLEERVSELEKLVARLAPSPAEKKPARKPLARKTVARKK